MKGDIKIGGRRVKNDSRDTRNWVGKLTLEATRDGDQFVLAAISRALFSLSRGPNDALAAKARAAINKLAVQCMKDHDARQK